MRRYNSVTATNGAFHRRPSNQCGQRVRTRGPRGSLQAGMHCCPDTRNSFETGSHLRQHRRLFGATGAIRRLRWVRTSGSQRTIWKGVSPGSGDDCGPLWVNDVTIRGGARSPAPIPAQTGKPVRMFMRADGVSRCKPDPGPRSLHEPAGSNRIVNGLPRSLDGTCSAVVRSSALRAQPRLVCGVPGMIFFA